MDEIASFAARHNLSEADLRKAAGIGWGAVAAILKRHGIPVGGADTPDDVVALAQTVWDSRHQLKTPKPAPAVAVEPAPPAAQSGPAASGKPAIMAELERCSRRHGVRGPSPLDAWRQPPAPTPQAAPVETAALVICRPDQASRPHAATTLDRAIAAVNRRPASPFGFPAPPPAKP